MKSKKIDWICIGIYIFIILFGIFGWKIVTKFLESNIENEIGYMDDIDTDIEFDLIIEPSEEIESEACDIGEEIQTPFYELTEYERWYIECMVAGEAGGESLLGKMAVAQCILNAMVKNGYSPKEVRINYKYSGWDEKLESKNPEMYEEVKHAVWCVFDNGEGVTDNPILYFYAPKKSAGKWHNTQEFDSEIGNHRFFYIASDLTADWFVNFKNNT